MRWTLTLCVLLWALGLSTHRAAAQVCGQWQTGIGPNGDGGGIAGTDGPINSLVTWDPDGAGPATELAVIAGQFSVAGTATVRVATDSGYLHGLATWDGQRWAAFPVSPEMTTGQTLTLLGTDGSTLVAAVRRSPTSSRIIAFDGTAWTELGGEFSGSSCALNCMAVVDGDIVVGGRFTQAGITAAVNVALWDGESWQAMSNGLSNGIVNALAVHQSELVAGGTFTVSGSAATTFAAKWNGTNWVQLGGGAPASIYSLASTGSSLYAARANSSGLGYGISIWNGEAWTTPAFVPQSWNPQSTLSAFKAHDGELWAAARFAGGSIQAGPYRVARWTQGGWQVVGPVSTAISSRADSLLLTFLNGEPLAAATSVYVGFTQPVVPVRRFVDGDWRPAGDGFDGPVEHLVDLGDDRVMAVGSFTGVGGHLVNGIARWNGSTWEPMDAGMPTPPLSVPRPEMRGAALFRNDPIIVGTFTSVDGDPGVKSVARWNGERWGPLGAPGAFGTEPATGIGFYHGDLLVSRRSGSYNARTHRIRRFDGASWTDLPGELATPYDTKPLRLLQFGDDLIAAGDITSAGGVELRGIARWNGETWSAMGDGLEPNFTDVKVCEHGGDLYALTFGVLHRWVDPVWSEISPYGLMSGYTGAMAIHSEHLWTSSSARGLVRLENDAWLRASGDRLQPYASALLPFGDDLLVAGAFLGSSDGRVISILARWTPEPDAPLIDPIESEYHARTGSYANLRFNLGGTGPYAVERIERDGVDVPFDYPHRVDTFLYSTGLLDVQVPSLALEDAGDYIVTISNGCGEVSSTPVTLTIQCAADFDSNGLTDVYELYGFLSAWFARIESANYNGDYSIDMADLFGWLSSWLSRC